MHRSLSALALFIATCGFLAVDSTNAAYHLSDNFDSSWSAPASQIEFVPLSNGTQLVHGPFDLLDGELIGSLAQLDALGNFAGPFNDPPFPGLDVTRVTELSDGGLSIIAYLPNSTDTWFFLFSAAGSLSNIRSAALTPLTIFQDRKYLFSETFQTDGVTFERMYKAAFTSEPTPVRDDSFSPVEIRGTIFAAKTLADGTVLIAGDFESVNGTLINSRLIKINPNGTLVSGFKLDGISDSNFTSYQLRIQQLSNGEIFLHTLGNATPSVYRLNTNGTIDTGFTWPSSLGSHQRTRLALAPGGGYFVLQCSLYDADTNDNLPIVRLKANGSLDSSFRFDRGNTRFFTKNAFTSSTVLPNGKILVQGPSDNLGTLRFATLDATGVATAADPGALNKSSKTTADWTPNGELLFWSERAVDLPGSENSGISNRGIARADGSLRALFDNESTFPSLALRDGRYLSPYFQIYGPDAQELPGIGVPFETTPLLEFPDSSLLVVQRVRNTYQVAKINRFGLPDPAYRPYVIPSGSGARAWLFGDSIYLASGSTDGSNTYRLRRLHLNGLTDASFNSLNLNELPSQVVETSTHLYVYRSYDPHLSMPLLKGGALKPLGARFSLTGALDTSFAPETKILPPPGAENSAYQIFAADGSSVVLANSLHPVSGNPSPDHHAALFLVSPAGVPTKITDSSTAWNEAYWSVAPNGSVFVSGSVSYGLTRLDSSAVYTPLDHIYSTPQSKIVSYSENEHSIVVTFLDAPGNTQFQWEKDGTDLPAEQSPTLTFSSLDKSNAGTYRLRITRGNVTSYAGPFELEAPYHPRIASQSTNPTATTFQRVTLSAFVEALPQPTFQWFLDGQPIDGATSASLEILFGSISQLGSYQLRARNALGENWTSPQQIEPSGWWPVVERSYGLTAFAARNLFNLFAAPNDAVAVVTEFNLDQSFNYDLVAENDSVTKDWGQSIDIGDYERIDLSSGFPRAFVSKVEYFGAGIEQRTRITFTRLKSDGSIDTAFGTHILEDESVASPKFLEKADGTVWAETKFSALSISPSGVETNLPRPLPAPYQGMYRLTSRYSTQLPDNSFLMLLDAEQRIYRTKTDGTLGDNPTTILLFDENEIILGFWNTGRSLRLNTATNSLFGEDLDGNIAWTLPLGDERLRSPYGDLLSGRITQSRDRSRFYLATYLEDASPKNHLFWIDESGAHTFDSGARFDGLDLVNAMVERADDTVSLLGFSTEKYGINVDVLLTVNGNQVSDTPLNLAKTVSASLDTISPLASDKTFFVSTSAQQQNGEDTMPIFKLSKVGEILESFDSSDAFDGLAFRALASDLQPTQDGGVLVSFQSPNNQIVRVLDSSGAKRFDIDASDVLTGPLVRTHGTDGVLSLVYRNNTGTSLKRFRLDGSLDTSFANDAIVFPELYSEMLVDSQNRIYVLATPDSSKPPVLKRLLANGTVDASFSLAPSLQEISRMVIGGSGKLLVANERLYRLNTNGSLDTSFNAQSTYIYPNDSIVPLANGTILVGNVILSSNGSQQEELNALMKNKSFIAHGNELARIDDTSFVRYAKNGFDHFLRLPRDTIAAPESSTSLRIQTKGTQNYTFQWFKDGQLLPNQTNPFLNFASLSESDEGSYQVLVTWDSGSLLLPAAELSVSDQVPTLVPADEKITLSPSKDYFSLTWQLDPESPTQLRYTEDNFLWESLPVELAYENETTTLFVPEEAIEKVLLFRLFKEAD